MRFESTITDGGLTLDDVMKVVTEIRDSQKQYEKSFNEACDSMDAQLIENTKALKAQHEQNGKLFKLVEDLSNENRDLKKSVKMLEERVEDLEQYSRNNCVEIQGIPQEKTEDVVSIVKDIGKAMDMEISDMMVDACHRLGGRQQRGDNPPGIILKFVRRIDKEEFLRKRRVKRSLSTRHIGRKDDHQIYINESLSPARRRLHALARAFRKEKNYQFLWVRNGKILLRKEESAPVKVVRSQEDLK